MFKHKKIKIDYELMPEMIATLDKPPSPLGSFVIWTVAALFIVAVFFSFFSKVDMVATTKGKIIPKDHFSIIRSSSEGIIDEIAVREGDQVKKGEVLVEFNSNLDSSQLSTTQKILASYIFENQILQGELNILDGSNLSTNNAGNFKGLSEEEKRKYYLLREAREIEYGNKVEKFNLSKESKEFEKNIVQINLENLTKKQKVLELEVKNLESSYNLGLATELDYKKKVNELNSIIDDIKSTGIKNSQLDKDLLEIEKNLSLVEKERKTQILTQIIANQKSIEEMKLKLDKDEQTFGFQKIYSPIDGKVNKISINNFSGFVGPGTEIMTIVPENAVLEAEIYIENKDIGFISIGQEVEIKLDTFPFQDYGMLKGTVRMISPDTVSKDNNETFMYKAYVTLVTTNLKVNGKEQFAKSGMTLTGEIKTGKRRIIDFILSPIKKSLKESISTR